MNIVQHSSCYTLCFSRSSPEQHASEGCSPHPQHTSAFWAAARDPCQEQKHPKDPNSSV